MSQRRTKYLNEEATISEVKALHGRLSQQLFCCERSRLQSRRELVAVSQGDAIHARASKYFSTCQ